MARSRSFRQIRKILRRKRKKISVMKRTVLVWRVVRRWFFRFLRFFVYFCFRLWLKRIHHSERFPPKGPAIIISNHLSYFDWAVLSAVYWNRYLVFIGNKDLLKRGFVAWLMKLNILIFINPNNPGLYFYKESLRRLDEDHILVIYPEGTRSRSGKMLEPKAGFVKLALRTGVPIIPIGMKGTYNILPPHKMLPDFKKCEIFVGKPIILNRRNIMFRDLFIMHQGHYILTAEAEREAAIRIMEIVQNMTQQEWDNPDDIKSKRIKNVV